LVQRVTWARVSTADRRLGEIGPGLLLLVGVRQGDDGTAVDFCADKCLHLRIFADDQGKMNRSLLDTGGQVLAISQFTLYGDCRRGRRPSFTEAALPATAEPLYRHFVNALRASGLTVAEGEFGAHMEVELCNDGPVTLWVESP
jgi:D-tyrosyl-tRNA(Tyr) deacylase